MFQQPDHFAIDYQGSGERSNTAGVKIQLEYDLLSGHLNVQLRPGTNNDTTFDILGIVYETTVKHRQAA